MHQSFYRHLFLGLLGKYLELELLYQKVTILSPLWINVPSTLLRTMHKSSGFSTFSLTLGIVIYVDFSYFHGSLVVSHCGFDLLFFLITSDLGHIFMCYLASHAFSSVKCLHKVLVYFQLVIFLLSFKGSLHILDTSPLSYVCVNMCPHAQAYL